MEKKEMSAASEARITLTKKYTKCVTDAGADTAAIEACDAILDSIKKLEWSSQAASTPNDCLSPNSRHGF